MNMSEFIAGYDECKSIEQYLFEMNENPATELGNALINRYNELRKELNTFCNDFTNSFLFTQNKVDIKLKTSDNEGVSIISEGDWIDLHTSEDVYMMKGEYQLIPLGVCMELAEGYEAIVVPRSSTFKKYGIIMANSIGVIDESYCGDNDMWQFPAVCLEDETHIPKGARIAQFRIIKHQPYITFKNVQSLDNPDRGGFGSTGI